MEKFLNPANFETPPAPLIKKLPHTEYSIGYTLKRPISTREGRSRRKGSKWKCLEPGFVVRTEMFMKKVLSLT